MTFEPLYTADEMRAAEAGVPGADARADGARRDVRRGRDPPPFPAARRVAVWCGTGANGGDGLVVATELAQAGREATVRLLGPEEKIAGDAAAMLGRAKEAGVAFWTSPALPTSPSTPSSARGSAASPEPRPSAPSPS